MSSFFGWYDVVRLVADTHEEQLVRIFQPYIIKNLDYIGMLPPAGGMTPSAAFDPDRILTALPTAEFRNVVAVKWDTVTDLRGLLIAALEKARIVEVTLAEEVSARP